MILEWNLKWLHMMTSVLRFKYFFTSVFLIIGLGLWLSYPRFYEFKGETFGTTYKVIIIGPKYSINPKRIKQNISNRLSQLDYLFSTYRKDSEIMTLNNVPVGKKIKLDSELVALIQLSQQLQIKIGKVWDPTIVPISKKYGFSTVQGTSGTDVGLNNVIVLDKFHLKKNANITLDLSSIAKGYAVDEISKLVNLPSVKGTYVDIGGEIKITGQKPGNTPWGIGIQSPTQLNQLAQVVYGTNLAIATSGNYLNYTLDKNNNRIGHIVDPLSKSSISHSMLSVSIIADQCAVADAVATGVFVMGPEKALEWLNFNQDYPALLIGNLIGHIQTVLFVSNGEVQLVKHLLHPQLSVLYTSHKIHPRHKQME